MSAWPTLQAAPNVDLPPWGWNPVATFQTAYNDAQEEKRAQQEFEVGMELEQILLPAKIAKAEYDTKKFAYDSKLLEKIYRTQSAALDNSYRGVTSAVGGSRGSGGSGASSNVAGNGGGSTPRTGSNVATLIQNWGGGSATPAGGGGGGKILGQGHTGDDY
jgi:hypothetical protein